MQQCCLIDAFSAVFFLIIFAMSDDGWICIRQLFNIVLQCAHAHAYALTHAPIHGQTSTHTSSRAHARTYKRTLVRIHTDTRKRARIDARTDTLRSSAVIVAFCVSGINKSDEDTTS